MRRQGSKMICPGCGKRSATDRVLERYRFIESGLPNIWLKGGVTETSCSRCGESFIEIEKLWQLLQVIAVALFMKPGFLTGDEMRFLRGACEMSQAALASALRHRRATVSERETRRNPGLSVAEEVWLRLVLLDSFRKHVRSDGNGFLIAADLRALDAFGASFCREALRVTGQMSRRGMMTAALDGHRKAWRLDSAA